MEAGKNCESCGMALSEKFRSKFDEQYCIYCQDQMSGRLKSKKEVREGCIKAGMRMMGKTRREAERMADVLMVKLPRWKKKGK